MSMDLPDLMSNKENLVSLSFHKLLTDHLLTDEMMAGCKTTSGVPVQCYYLVYDFDIIG